MYRVIEVTEYDFFHITTAFTMYFSRFGEMGLNHRMGSVEGAGLSSKLL